MVQPNIEFTHTMKGVTPDIEIKPNFQQILERKDIELEWILKEIKGKINLQGFNNLEGLSF